MPGTRIFAMSQDSVRELQQGEIIQADTVTQRRIKKSSSPQLDQRGALSAEQQMTFS